MYHLDTTDYDWSKHPKPFTVAEDIRCLEKRLSLESDSVTKDKILRELELIKSVLL